MRTRKSVTKKTQQKVIRLRERGFSYKEISENLGISKHYVNNFVSAHNAGFSSPGEYTLANLSKRGFQTYNHYRLARASNNGDHNSSSDSSPKQYGFEESILVDERIVQRAHYSLLGNLNESETFQEVLSADIQRILESYLARLTPYQREVIEARFYKGKTLQELGKNFNRSRDAIRKTEVKALERLRLFIQKQDKLTLQDFF